MTLYAAAKYPIREDLVKIHAAQFAQLGEPGTWGSAAQRQAVCLEAREACYDAGMLQRPANAQTPAVQLPEVAKRLVRKLAAEPQGFEEADYQEALKEGLSDAEYVEMVGLVSRITNLDIFAKGIGVEVQPLPPAQPGNPSRERPPEAIQEKAWVPTVPGGPDGGETAKWLYVGLSRVAYILKALSLVPKECALHLELEQVEYIKLPNFMDWTHAHHEGLSRAQVEVVAGRVSAFNECFY
jgi:hypothetical protein